MRERALLLTKMNTNYERRFPHDKELMSTFLDVILFVYTDDTLQAELGQKLESAFMTGTLSYTCWYILLHLQVHSYTLLYLQVYSLTPACIFFYTCKYTLLYLRVHSHTCWSVA